MSTESSSLKIKENHIAVLGKEFGTLYNSLHNEVVWLYMKWSEYKELFGKKESRVTLLNNSSPQFFFVVQKVLWNDVLLGISKITDNTKVAGKRTTTLKSIPDFINDSETKNRFIHHLNELIININFCRDWRNRVIAHKDFDLIISEKAKPLEPANGLKIDHAFESIFALLNIVENHYFGSNTMFKYLEYGRGAISLMHLLNDGISARKEQNERIKKGDFTTQDLKVHDI